MTRQTQIFRHLQAVKDPCVDRAMAQALPTADGEALRLIALLLLQRRQVQGLIALVEHYHRLPTPIRQTVLEHAPELARALRVAMDNKKSAGPANAVHIIRKSLSVRQAYLIADQLRQGHDRLKDESALCLLEMAQRTASTDPRGTPVGRPNETGFVQSAVKEALRFYPQHKRRDVLRAMFALPLPQITELLGSLGEPGAPAVHQAGVMLTRSNTASIRSALIQALPHAGLQPFAIDGIRLAIEAGTFGEALGRWHLLKLKPYRNALKRIKNPDGYLPAPDFYKDAQAPQVVQGLTAGLGTWLSELPLDPAKQVRQLALLNKAADPATRLGALRLLLTLSRDTPVDAPVHTAIAGFCLDPSEHIVRVALAHLIRRQYPETAKILAQLVNSPHAQVQKIAGKRLVPVAFPRLWDSWGKLDHAQRISAGKALIKIDPGFHTALQDKLYLPDNKAKLKALSIIGDLNQGLLLQDAILRLCKDKDAHVVSAAVKALGTAEPGRARGVIESALGHEDDRVRANAVEALARMDASQHVDQLTAMTGEDEGNRARANAIQVLMQMRAGDALQALSRMLNDPRPEHRTSALWLVESMGIVEVAREVAEMSISEPNATIRQRAERVILQVIDEMSQPLPIQTLMPAPSDDGPAETTGVPGVPAPPKDHAAAG